MRKRKEIEEDTQKKVQTATSAAHQQIHIEVAILEILLDIRNLLIEINHKT